ncbi:transcriptional attenuator, LytR family [Micromonospora pattaloongensis]|uniref:Transcriptional attenuator, LytR family n=1 Tax=Micromonospora pattaloongensis TaxID=405436 RepID=A0A1H3PDW7_9ACTN|nr:LCP family protein [Micromonospora pattaloongensis]SDY99344.1 transcriptional attenuator, LytR family [Micromonospora pattaloongensis]
MSSQHSAAATTRSNRGRGHSTVRERRALGAIWRGLRRVGLVGLVVVISASIGTAATAYLVGARLNTGIGRIGGAFAGIDPGSRPATDPAAARGETILAVGSDLRSSGQSTGLDATDDRSGPADQRTDVIMLIRLDRLHRSASVVSIPRDSWVNVPDHGMMKINAAYPLGGPPLLVRTVEELTRVRVDHFMIIDFAGFRAIVDALGGIDVQVAAGGETGDPALRPGANHLDGNAALAYVRERSSLPEGDLDRIRRQQNLLRAVFTGIAGTDPARDPMRVYRLLDATTRAVTVDDSFRPEQLRELAFEAAGLGPQRLWFLTAPLAGTGWEDGQSVVHLDTPRGAALWQALRTDAMTDYVAAHQQDLLPTAPR